MRKVNLLIFFIITTLSIHSFTANAQDWIEDIQHYRDSVDQVFADPEFSILKEEDVESFHGLSYYEINEKFRVKATFEPVDKSDYFKMKTTTERLPEYRVFGMLSFTLNGASFTIPVYQNKELVKRKGYEHYLFLPFTDETNYEGSYPGGRYLDFQSTDIVEGEVTLDFNRCYNPYCAYNDRYSCPIPPTENHIATKIEAGVRYDKH